MRHRSLLARVILIAAAFFCAGGVARANPPVHLCRIGQQCLPNLVVRYDETGGQQGFIVYNESNNDAGQFRISVLMGSDSYGFEVDSMEANASQYFPVYNLACGQGVTVIVNPFNALPESSYTDNAISFYGWCGL